MKKILSIIFIFSISGQTAAAYPSKLGCDGDGKFLAILELNSADDTYHGKVGQYDGEGSLPYYENLEIAVDANALILKGNSRTHRSSLEMRLDTDNHYSGKAEISYSNSGDKFHFKIYSCDSVRLSVGE